MPSTTTETQSAASIDGSGWLGTLLNAGLTAYNSSLVADTLQTQATSNANAAAAQATASNNSLVSQKTMVLAGVGLLFGVGMIFALKKS